MKKENVMPEPSIPVRLLIEQVESSVACLEWMAGQVAQDCREGRIGWLYSDDDLWARQSQADVVHRAFDSALATAGDDLLPTSEALRNMCEAAKARIQALRDELRTSYLLSGPFAPKREAA